MLQHSNGNQKSVINDRLILFIVLLLTISLYSTLVRPENFTAPDLTQISQFDDLYVKMIHETSNAQILKQEDLEEDKADMEQAKGEDSSCDDLICRASGGNCKNGNCENDGAAELDVDQFSVPKPLKKYNWENENITNAMLLNHTDSQIPFIFHRSWKSSKIPDQPYPYWRNVKNCDKTHQNWVSVLWTDEDNLELVRRDYPEYLYIYQRLQKSIERADFARYLYLHRYGGLYVDLDVDCIKNSEELIKDKKVVLGKMGEDFPHNIPNAIMYSVKGHKFWLFVINMITVKMHQNAGTEATTGPAMLKDSYELLRKVTPFDNEIHVTEPGILYGVDWRLRDEKYPECGSAHTSADYDKCKLNFPNAYLVTYWAHQWEDTSKMSNT
eukprot:NODE_203_length_14950_cov_0.414450.p4 type:complete len:384 gc:universal NODE_203_length_14950_cov_0.414450:5347-6498(+)